jgi:hypothetical protein
MHLTFSTEFSGNQGFDSNAGRELGWAEPKKVEIFDRNFRSRPEPQASTVRMTGLWAGSGEWSRGRKFGEGKGRRWTVGVGAPAGVDATLRLTRHGAELAWQSGRASLAARVGMRVGDVGTQ